MAENLIHQLIPHQGCVIKRTADGIDISGSAMNWVMSAGVEGVASKNPLQSHPGTSDQSKAVHGLKSVFGTARRVATGGRHPSRTFLVTAD